MSNADVEQRSVIIIGETWSVIGAVLAVACAGAFYRYASAPAPRLQVPEESKEESDGTPNANEDTLRAMRAASPALQEWWPGGKEPAKGYRGAHDGESPR